MSDSDGSAMATIAIPSDAKIEKELRRVVAAAFKQGTANELTLKTVRAKATQELGLPEGFLKSDQKWNSKSKNIVSEEVDAQEDALTKPSQTKAPTKQAVPTKEPVQKNPAKRKVAEDRAKPSKRRKTVISSSEGEDDGDSEVKPASLDAESDVEHKETATPQSKSKLKQTSELNDDDLSSPIDDPPVKKRQKKTKAKEGSAAETRKLNSSQAGDKSKSARELDDGDLSSPIDDSPAPKRRKKGESKEPASQKASKPKPSKAATSSGPQNEEIKRLQGYLVKCGIRKLWGKELAKFDNDKQKISHLKSMLEEAGMTGRFSDEKARQIKEERELRADLDAIKEGDQKWGLDDEQPRGRRAAARKPPVKQQVVFTDSDEEVVEQDSAGVDDSDEDSVEDSEEDSGEGSAVSDADSD